MRGVVCFLAFGACGFSVPAGPRDGAAGTDDGTGAAATVDGPNVDAPAGGLCFGEGNFIVCLAALPTSAVRYDGVSSIITSGGQCPGEVVIPSTGPELCVVAGTTVTVNEFVDVSGTRPLVLVATSGALTVTSIATIDASAFRNGGAGPGSNFASCAAPGTAGSASNGSGGGAGGSFGTRGGNGGAGGGAAGGTAAPASTPVFLRGGCRGAVGGTSSGAGGLGGDSGGALYLVANTTLSINGRIDASGASGDGAPSGKGGGGGGGSGGMIALWGRNGISIGATAVVFANGAGGGGGADAAAPGGNGFESTGPLVIGAGGPGGNGVGTAGGAGATLVAPGQSATASTKGGGGGGGGVGVIKNVSGQSITAGSFSPPPS